MGLGRGGNQDTGIGMFKIRSKPAACGASPLFHLSSCGEFFRLGDLTSQGRRMGAGVCVWGPTFLLVTLQEARLTASQSLCSCSPHAPLRPTSCPGDARSSRSHLYLAPKVWEPCLQQSTPGRLSQPSEPGQGSEPRSLKPEIVSG